MEFESRGKELTRGGGKQHKRQQSYQNGAGKMIKYVREEQGACGDRPTALPTGALPSGVLPTRALSLTGLQTETLPKARGREQASPFTFFTWRHHNVTSSIPHQF